MAEPQSPTNEFEAAKAVVSALEPLPKAGQERVIRWVAESLGLTELSAPAPRTRPEKGAPTPDDRHEQREPTEPQRTPGSVDIASFVEQKSPRSDTQFVATVAYYYQFEAPEQHRRPTITADIVRDATRLANWDRLNDPANTLNNAKKQGYLDGRARGEYALSIVGENLVARSLPPAVDATATRKRTAKKSKVAKKSARR